MQDRYSQALVIRLKKANDLLAQPKETLYELSQNPTLRKQIDTSLNETKFGSTAVDTILNSFATRSAGAYNRVYWVPASCYSSQGFKPPEWADERIANEDLFSGASELISIPGQQSVYVGTIRTVKASTDEGKVQVVPFALGIRNVNGEIAGVLVVELIVKNVFDSLVDEKQTTKSDESHTWILDSNGRLLNGHAESSERSWLEERPNDSQTILRSTSGIVMDSKDKPDAIQIFSRIRPQGQSAIHWTVVDEIPLGSALYEVRLSQALFLFLALSCLGVSLWGVRLVTRSIVEPLETLVEATKQVGDEDFDALLPTNATTTEVATLASSMGTMREKIRTLLADLRFASNMLETSQRLSKTGGWEVDLDRDIVFWTEQTYRIHGLEPLDIQSGIDLERAIHFYEPASQPLLREALNTAIQKGETSDLTLQLKTATGRIKWVHIVSLVMLDANKKVKLSGAIQDITETVTKQQAIKQSEELLRKTGQVANIGGWEVDLKTKVATWSEQTSRIYELDGATAQSIETSLSFYSQDVRSAIGEKIASAIRDNVSWDIETEMTTAKGNPKWVHIQGSAVYENGVAVRLYGSVHDVTKEILNRHASDEQQRLLQSCLDNMQPGVAIISDSGFIYANSPFKLILGFTSLDSLENISLVEVVAKNDHAVLNARRTKALHLESVPTPILIDLVRNDGTLCKCLTNISSINWNGEQHLLISFSPLTEADMVEVEIRATHDRYEKLLVTQLEKQQADIAHELHDTLGTELAGVAILLAGYMQKNPEVHNELQLVLEHVKRSAALSRNLAHGLMPVDASAGSLWRALDRLCEKYREVGNVACRLIADAEFDFLSAAQSNHLYRISKEALVNAIKHGGATEVTIKLSRYKFGLSMEVIDNGTSSLDINEIREGKSGIGLKSMRARAKLLGATLDFYRNDLGGLTVLLKWSEPESGHWGLDISDKAVTTS